MNNLKQIQEQIEIIKKRIYDTQLGVRLATTQEVANMVSDEIRPTLNLLTNKLEYLEDQKIQLTKNKV